MTLTSVQKNILNWLDGYGEYYVSFATLMVDLNYDRPTVRDACRALAKDGLAEFRRGLMTDEGMLAGSGYAITEAGRKALADLWEL